MLPSISRLFTTLAIPEQKQLSAKLRDLLATYTEAEDLIQIGAYTKGSSPTIDQAIQFQPAILAFLRQAVAEGSELPRDPPGHGARSSASTWPLS